MPISILVTGGAGYIGSHTCKALRRAGLRPVVYDNLSRGHAEAVKWGPLEVGDVLDKERLKGVMLRYRPAAVLHFAALAYVGESVSAPGDYYNANALGTLTLLQTMRETGLDLFVLSSTCAVYGPPQSLPIREDHRMTPINPYGASKLMAERIVADCAGAHHLRAITLRYFNAAGADPQGDIGEVHEPETHLIPIVLEAAAGLRSHVTINGTDYPTSDGTCVRDFVHVSDLAQAHVLAIRRLLQGAPSASYNLGNGKGHSIREVIDMAENVTGRRIPAIAAPRRNGDPAVLVADPSRAMRELDWHPERSSLALQIADAWRWQQRRLPRPAQEIISLSPTSGIRTPAAPGLAR
jgi:UDP-glucose-4-epimerase GalE